MKLFIWTFLLLLISGPLFSQTAPESSTTIRDSQSYLELSKKSKPSEKVFLKEGKRIEYKLKGSSISKKTRIGKINDGSITVNGIDLSFSYFSWIKARGLKVKAMGKAPQIAPLVGGGIVTILGILIIAFAIKASRDNDFFTGLIVSLLLLLFFCLPILFMGLMILLIGAMVHRKFDFENEWDIKKK